MTLNQFARTRLRRFAEDLAASDNLTVASAGWELTRTLRYVEPTEEAVGRAITAALTSTTVPTRLASGWEIETGDHGTMVVTRLGSIDGRPVACLRDSRGRPYVAKVDVAANFIATGSVRPVGEVRREVLDRIVWEARRTQSPGDKGREVAGA